MVTISKALIVRFSAFTAVSLLAGMSRAGQVKSPQSVELLSKAILCHGMLRYELDTQVAYTIARDFPNDFPTLYRRGIALSPFLEAGALNEFLLIVSRLPRETCQQLLREGVEKGDFRFKVNAMSNLGIYDERYKEMLLTDALQSGLIPEPVPRNWSAIWRLSQMAVDSSSPTVKEAFLKAVRRSEATTATLLVGGFRKSTFPLSSEGEPLPSARILERLFEDRRTVSPRDRESWHLTRLDATGRSVPIGTLALQAAATFVGADARFGRQMTAAQEKLLRSIVRHRIATLARSSSARVRIKGQFRRSLESKARM